jgi:hypothetical protein
MWISVTLEHPEMMPSELRILDQPMQAVVRGRYSMILRLQMRSDIFKRGWTIATHFVIGV